MSEARHTSGPWSLETVPTSIGSCHKIGPFPSAGHRPQTYACVYADGVRIGIDEKSAPAIELLANARLMAAAPDLLEALQMIHRSFGGGNVITFSNRDIELIGAAIARATGDAS
jgi:hypothetical protein